MKGYLNGKGLGRQLKRWGFKSPSLRFRPVTQLVKSIRLISGKSMVQIHSGRFNYKNK